MTFPTDTHFRTCLNLAIFITSHKGMGKAGFPQCIGAAQLQTEADNYCKSNSHTRMSHVNN